MLQTSQVVQGLVTWDYYLLFFGLTANLCLVQGLSTLKTSPSAPFFKLSFANTYVVHDCYKMRVEPNPTLKLTTQATTRATMWWFELGLQLGKS